MSHDQHLPRLKMKRMLVTPPFSKLIFIFPMTLSEEGENLHIILEGYKLTERGIDFFTIRPYYTLKL
jgi:hypothetical protein